MGFVQVENKVLGASMRCFSEFFAVLWSFLA